MARAARTPGAGIAVVTPVKVTSYDPASVHDEASTHDWTEAEGKRGSVTPVNWLGSNTLSVIDVGEPTENGIVPKMLIAKR